MSYPYSQFDYPETGTQEWQEKMDELAALERASDARRLAAAEARRAQFMRDEPQRDELFQWRGWQDFLQTLSVAVVGLLLVFVGVWVFGALAYAILGPAAGSLAGRK